MSKETFSGALFISGGVSIKVQFGVIVVSDNDTHKL